MSDTTHNPAALAIKHGFTWPMSEPLKMEAAMVLWEEINDWFSSSAHPHMVALQDYRANTGTCQLRHDVMQLVEPLHIAWGVYVNAQDYDSSFDWEFTPWFLAKCVDWDAETGATLKADWIALAQAATI